MIIFLVALNIAVDFLFYEKYRKHFEHHVAIYRIFLIIIAFLAIVAGVFTFLNKKLDQFIIYASPKSTIITAICTPLTALATIASALLAPFAVPALKSPITPTWAINLIVAEFLLILTVAIATSAAAVLAVRIKEKKYEDAIDNDSGFNLDSINQVISSILFAIISLCSLAFLILEAIK